MKPSSIAMLMVACLLATACSNEPPKVGAVYSYDPDPWCVQPRVIVVDVKDEFVRIRTDNGLERARPLDLFTGPIAIYHLDPYNCWGPR